MPGVSSVAGPPADGETFDAGDYDIVDFVSPSGRIFCSMNSDGVDCQPPIGLMPAASVPSEEEACPESVGINAVNTLHVGDGKAAWACFGGLAAYPIVDGHSTAWNSSGFGEVVRPEGWDRDLVSLPYGKNLAHDGYLCRSREDGVTCTDSNGVGFKASRSGVTFYP